MKRIILIATIFLAACSSSKKVSAPYQPGTSISINGKLFATIFQQKAEEYRALCFQAYNIAQLRLDNYKPETGKPKAIVTDIDETVLDNSPYEAHQTLQGKDYEPDSWYAWTDKSAAEMVPGAADFLKYAASKGITIFYITNRTEREMGSTIQNLKKFGLPNADSSHFIYKQTTSSKEVRREAVAANFEIMMLIGDNLGDFSVLFDKSAVKDNRLTNTNLSAKKFGDRFIVIPNTAYGDWEGSLFRFNKLTQAQKDSVIRAEVRSY